MDVHAVRAFLRTVEPLAGFADADLSPLAAHLRERRLRAGQVLVREGEPGSEMYFIRRGELAVVKRITGGRSGEVEQVVGRVGPGEFVGEMALFDRRPRSATMRAESDTEVFVLDRAAVEVVLGLEPHHLLDLALVAEGHLDVAEDRRPRVEAHAHVRLRETVPGEDGSEADVHPPVGYSPETEMIRPRQPLVNSTRPGRVAKIV